MYTLYEDRINWVLKEISKGFKLSPLNITIFFLLVTAIVVLFIYLSKRAESRLKNKLIRIFYKRFQNKIVNLKLTSHEIELLKSLLTYIKELSNKFLLLEDEYVFQNATKRLLEKNPDKEQEISALKVKLGFKKYSMEAIPNSTAQLVDNTTINLVDKNHSLVAIGKVIEIKPEYILVDIIEEEIPLKKRNEYIAQFQYRSGIFYFKTRCLTVKNTLAFLSHSERIRRTQRRSFYRKNIQIPVSIHSKVDERSYYSYTTDLGGGGVCVKGSPDFFHPGENVTILIDIPKKGRITSTARIIDISKTKNIIRVSFSEIKESDRDKIIKFIFKQ